MTFDGEELAAETARLRGWRLDECGRWVTPVGDTTRTGGEYSHYVESGWDPANRIEQAQELVEVVKQRGLLDEFTCYLTDRAEEGIGHPSEFPSDYFLWWFGVNQALEITRAFIAVMEEANG